MNIGKATTSLKKLAKNLKKKVVFSLYIAFVTTTFSFT